MNLRSLSLAITSNILAFSERWDVRTVVLLQSDIEYSYFSSYDESFHGMRPAPSMGKIPTLYFANSVICTVPSSNATYHSSRHSASKNCRGSQDSCLEVLALPSASVDLIPYHDFCRGLFTAQSYGIAPEMMTLILSFV